MVCALPAAARKMVILHDDDYSDDDLLEQAEDHPWFVDLETAWNRLVTTRTFDSNPDTPKTAYERVLPRVGRAGVAKIVRELLAERRKKGHR